MHAEHTIGAAYTIFNMHTIATLFRISRKWGIVAFITVCGFITMIHVRAIERIIRMLRSDKLCPIFAIFVIFWSEKEITIFIESAHVGIFAIFTIGNTQCNMRDHPQEFIKLFKKRSSKICYDKYFSRSFESISSADDNQGTKKASVKSTSYLGLQEKVSPALQYHFHW